MSHQHALAQVTAQAPQAHSRMQNQAEFPSSVSAAPASLLPRHPPFASSTVETNQQITHYMRDPSIKMESSDLSHSDQGCQTSIVTTHQQITHTMPDPSIIKKSSDFSHFNRRSKHSFTVEYPAEDGYNWRNYGMKELLSGSTRGYYKCTHPECTAKKQAQFSPNGQITETILRGLHNHQPPQGSAELTKDGHRGNLNKLEGVPAYRWSLKDQEASQVTTGNKSGPGESEKVGHSESRVDGRDEDESETEKR